MRPAVLSILALLGLSHAAACAALSAEADRHTPAAASATDGSGPAMTEKPEGAAGTDETGAEDPRHRPVARVGDETIRLSDLFYWVRKHPNELQSFGVQWGRDVVLGRIIRSTLLAAAATEHFADDPAHSGESVAKLVNRYRARFLTPPADVGDDELRTFYEAHIDDFGIPPMVRVRELFFPKTTDGVEGKISDASVAAARSQAEAVYRELQAGAPFEQFAAEFAPDEPTRALGGDRGFLSLPERPMLAQVTADMSPGDISEPVELDSGFTIVKLLDRRAGVPAPFEEVRGLVARRVLERRRDALVADFFERESERRGVEILLPKFAGAWPPRGSVVGSGPKREE